MPDIEVSDALQLMKDLWRRDTSYELTDELAKKYFKTAVFHVETIDYPQDNEWTVNENNDITFTTTPANSSYMLYVYRGLDDLLVATISGRLEDGKLGVSWRSGMETISTATAGRIQSGMSAEFSKRYKDALMAVKIKGQSIWRYDIYGDLS